MIVKEEWKYVMLSRNHHRELISCYGSSVSEMTTTDLFFLLWLRSNHFHIRDLLPDVWQVKHNAGISALGTAYLSKEPELILVFWGVHAAQYSQMSLVFL